MAMWIQKIQEIQKKKTVRVAGLISGTSADGIDVAICDIVIDKGSYRSCTVRAFHTVPYSSEVKKKIGAAASLTIRDIAELDLEIGEEFAKAHLAVCSQAKIDAATIDLISSHGQTVYHHSRAPGALKATMQLGCADTIAARTGVVVAHDFRRKDIVYGGEGAPLTPFSDYLLYFAPSKRRAVLNLGGIGNITVLADTADAVRGFDTGPANAPLDRLVTIYTNGKEDYDRDGKIAISGTVVPKLLNELMTADAFIKQAPPKSSGFEVYGDSFVRFVMGLHGGRVDKDLIATVTEYVAQTISYSIQSYVGALDELILAGGGAKNPALKRAIEKAVLPTLIKLSDDVGIPSDAREAIGFALIGLYAALGINNSIAGVTGAQKAACLGKFAFA